MPRLCVAHEDMRVSTQMELGQQEVSCTSPAGHTAILPVPARPNRAVLKALNYAMSLCEDVILVHVRTDGPAREAVQANWKKFGGDKPLIVLESPQL